jgi:hypothetical protein
VKIVLHVNDDTLRSGHESEEGSQTRTAKIEALISEVTERSSASAPHIRQLLRDAKAAVIRAKEAVSLQASSGMAKNPPAKGAKHPSKATPEPSIPKRSLPFPASWEQQATRRNFVAVKEQGTRPNRVDSRGNLTKVACPKRPPSGAAWNHPRLADFLLVV